jgi:hypothetical protein
MIILTTLLLANKGAVIPSLAWDARVIVVPVVTIHAIAGGRGFQHGVD